LKLPSYQELFTNHQRIVASPQSAFACPVAIDPGSNHFLPYAMNMNLCPWGNSGLSQPTKYTDVLQPIHVVALTDGPGPYSATFPSKNPYTPRPRHSNRLVILFLNGNVQSFAGNYVGCAMGDLFRNDVRWLTGTESDWTASKY
jgi:hypothetical protein